MIMRVEVGGGAVMRRDHGVGATLGARGLDRGRWVRLWAQLTAMIMRESLDGTVFSGDRALKPCCSSKSPGHGGGGRVRGCALIIAWCESRVLLGLITVFCGSLGEYTHLR